MFMLIPLYVVMATVALLWLSCVLTTQMGCNILIASHCCLVYYRINDTVIIQQHFKFLTYCYAAMLNFYYTYLSCQNKKRENDMILRDHELWIVFYQSTK